MYGLILASAAAQFALVPVMPVYAHQFGLSGLQQGLLLGATGLATLAVSVPAGTLSDRFGARRITLAAGLLMAAATFGQALAGSFPALLAARLTFGAGYGVLWTAGLCWLAAAAGGPRALGGSVASAGVGGVAGPAVSGALTEHLGLAVPLLAAAAGFAVITAALAALRVPPARSTSRRGRPGRACGRSGRDRDVIGAAAAVVTAGLSTGACALLVPAQLHLAGASSGQIGLVFAAAGILFAAGSALTTAVGGRAVNLPVICAGHAGPDRRPFARRAQHRVADPHRDAVRRHRGPVRAVDGQLPAGCHRGRAARPRPGRRGRAAQRHLGGDGGARPAGRRARRRAPRRPRGLRADRGRLRRRAGRHRHRGRRGGSRTPGTAAGPRRRPAGRVPAGTRPRPALRLRTAVP